MDIRIVCPVEKKMQSAGKIIPYPELAIWRGNLSEARRPLVVTNGCFDLLHTGHISLLEQARARGGALLVGLTSDVSIRTLKGPGRPIYSEAERARLLVALEAVDGVCMFPEVDAVNFLEGARPDIYVKGADYTLATINQDERRLLEATNVRIEFLPLVAGQSTSALIQRIARGAR